MTRLLWLISSAILFFAPTQAWAVTYYCTFHRQVDHFQNEVMVEYSAEYRINERSNSATVMLHNGDAAAEVWLGEQAISITEKYFGGGIVVTTLRRGGGFGVRTAQMPDGAQLRTLQRFGMCEASF